MNSHKVLILAISLSLLLPSFNLFVAASEDTNPNTENCKIEPSNSFEEAWPVLQTAVDKLVNRIEGVDNSSFTSEEYMLFYTTVYELCTTRQGDENAQLLYDQYKKVFEEYINSTVLPSLRGKKGEILLRELHKRWSNHKIMTSWLSRFFHYIDRYYTVRRNLPSLPATSFLSFFDLVYGETNKQVMDAVLSMINQEHAGEQIDQTLVNNVLAMYSEVGDMSRKYHGKGVEEEMVNNIVNFYSYGAPYWITSHSLKDNLPQEEKLHDNQFMATPSKNIILKSSDGEIFEVDYAVAAMSETIKSMIETNPARNTISLSKMSGKILAKVVEYCKKHVETSSFRKQISDVDLKKWDADFVEVDQSTLFDLVLSANYLNIKNLLDLTSQKIADMIKRKSPDEIRKFFNIKDDFAEQKEEAHKENQWAFE